MSPDWQSFGNTAAHGLSEDRHVDDEIAMDDNNGKEAEP